MPSTSLPVTAHEAIATPIAPSARVLDGRDLAILWGSLGVGLLVMEAGTFLSDLGLARATAAIALGSAVGALLLALAGRVGAVEGVPSMVLLRPLLGVRGSYLPSAANVLQLVGWTAFELWVMGTAAAAISPPWLGGIGRTGWIVAFAACGTLLALGGPLVVVRRFLERFGVWAMLAASVYLSWRLVGSVDLAALWSAPPRDGAGFWGMVDLVIAMPVSWLPLVADYTRFARTPRAAFGGTFAGYVVANAWFYGLGVVAVLAARLSAGASPADLAVALAGLGGGALALVAVLVDEIDNVFADIYSAALSTRNIRPEWGQRVLVVAIGVLGAGLAAFVTMIDYFNFLLLIGSVFTPLFGVLLAEHYIVAPWRARRTPRTMRVPAGPGWLVRMWWDSARRGQWWSKRLRPPALVAWVLGIAAFHVAARILPVGGSLPALAAAGGFYILLAAAEVGAAELPEESTL